MLCCALSRLPLTRDYALEAESTQLKRVPAPLHPLLPRERLAQLAPQSAVAASPNAATAASSFSDPLAAASPRKAQSFIDPLSGGGGAKPKAEVFDPLRAMASADKAAAQAASSSSSSSASGAAAQAQANIIKAISKIESVSYGAVQAEVGAASPGGSSTSITGKTLPGPTAECYEPWRDKRAPILTKYTTNKRIPVQANFLEEEKVAAPKAVDSAKSRLEELEQQAVEAAAAAEGGPMSAGKVSMSQKEYITHIEEQHERLKVAWEAGERVTSLKIAIQCAKLLGDSSVPQFYPSMYVLLTDILDTFGDLVFERIKRKGIDVINSQTKVKTAVSLPCNFKHTDVSASAQETCRNWFYKTAWSDTARNTAQQNAQTNWHSEFLPLTDCSLLSVSSPLCLLTAFAS